MSAFVFGKMPGHGDFVARGLTAERRERLDAWLSQALNDARESLGHAFDAAYDRAPPWRFAYDDGEEGWAAGALAPSVDAAGRRFPLLAGRTNVVAEGATAVAEAVEAVLYEALTQGWTVDQVLAAAEDVPVTPASPVEGDRWWTVGGGADDIAFPAATIDGAAPPDLISRMLTCEAVR